MLQHLRSEHALQLTVYGDPPSACAAVVQQLSRALSALRLEDSFGLASHFQVKCKHNGQDKCWPLQQLSVEHPQRALWGASDPQQHPHKRARTSTSTAVPAADEPCELAEMHAKIDAEIEAAQGCPPQLRNGFFLSHYQANGGDQACVLHTLLDPHGGCWYDQTAASRGDHITLAGMVKGVATARCFVLLLTKGIFERWFCRLEIRTALRLGKPILMVFEADARHEDAYQGPSDREVGSYAAQAPPDMKRLFTDVEAVPFRCQPRLYKKQGGSERNHKDQRKLVMCG